MTSKHKSSDYKESAVQYYLVEDKSQEEVCKVFKCTRRSLMRWVQKYKKDGKITGYERTPKAYKVHKEHVDFLLQEIKKNKTITTEDLLHLLKNKFPNLDLNKSHVSSQEVFKKYTGIFAISVNGVAGWDLYEKSGINADRMVEFLEANITNKFKNKLIILDNASSHRNPKVKEVINKDNHLLYAVPYQHFTNSIENYFSMLKSRLQKLDGLTHAELKKNITNTIMNIPKEKYKNIIKGAYERPEKYISKKNNTRKIKKNYL